MSNTDKSKSRKTATLALKNPSILQQAEQSKVETEPKKSGRKRLPEDEKATNRVTLLLNDKELKKFQEKSGIIADGTFLKHILMTQTDLFD